MEFSDYLTILFSLSALFFSVYTYKKLKKEDMRPVLVFSRKGEGGWELKNAGKGPALNLVIIDKDHKNNIRDEVLCFPLSSDATKELLWIKAGYSLTAIYSDYENNYYCSLLVDHKHVYKKMKTKPKISSTLSKEHFMIIATSINYNEALSEKDLESLTPWELKLKRNEIYARHGYIFTDIELLTFFSKQDWYKPTISNQFIAYKKFSDIERYNVEFILNYQKFYAKLN